jgi:very-short-patch-repair endonuclease
VPLYDEAGLIGRVDFLWRKHRIVGEADGRAKYDRPQVLWNEKRREDRLRAAGFEVVRWSWDDITHRPELVSERLLTAFARASARTSQL